MREIHVVGAAILDGGKVLAAQRSMDMDSPLKWEFVGGKLESGETNEKALEREVDEELGVKIRVGRFLSTGEAEGDDKKIILHVYEAEIIAGRPIAKEHAQLKWVEIDRIGELEWAEADIPACKKLMSMYCATCWNTTGKLEGDTYE